MCPPRRRPPRLVLPRRSSRVRRGSALLLVVLLVGAALALSVAFLNAGATETRLAANADRAEAARRAARTGLTTALAAMSSPDWRPDWDAATRVADGPRAALDADARGQTVYETFYAADVAPRSDDPADVFDAALSVRVTCRAAWEGADGGRTTARASAVVRLAPRTGRSAEGAGDDFAPDDAALTPLREDGEELWDPTVRRDWRTATRHAIAATGDLPDAPGTSVRLAPQVRVAGDVWARGQVRWPTTEDELGYKPDARDELQSSLGRLAPGSAAGSAGAPAAFPAPLGGAVAIWDGEETETRDLLDDLRVARVPAGDPLGRPSWNHVGSYDLAGPATYRLFAGGPAFRTAALADVPGVNMVGATVEVSRDLGPTPRNPLGIYVHDGPVRVTGGATVTGTLAARRVDLIGDATVRSVSWPAERGDARPRTPAVIVKEGLAVDGTGRVLVEGGVVSNDWVRVQVGTTRGLPPTWGTVDDLQIEAGGRLRVSLDGLAPWEDLPGYPADGSYRLRFGDRGETWPIVQWDPTLARVHLAGAADAPGAAIGARWSIEAGQPSCARFVGPVIARTVTALPNAAWGDLSIDAWAKAWEVAQDIWVAEEAGGAAALTEFVALLADPARWDEVWNETHGAAGAPTPWGSAGLPVVPTVAFVHHPPGETGSPHPVAFAPPLFRPDPAATGPDAGLRWEALTWDESGE